MEDLFVPQMFELNAPTAGELYRLRFTRADGASREVHLLESHLPQILTLVQRKIPPGQSTPISIHSLVQGRRFGMRGWSIVKQGETVLLTLSVELTDEGRDVTIPLEMSPAEAREMIIELVRAI